MSIDFVFFISLFDDHEKEQLMDMIESKKVDRMYGDPIGEAHNQMIEKFVEEIQSTRG